MTNKELMQMALTALCNSSRPASGYRRNELHLTPKPHIEIYRETIEALRTALAQPELGVTLTIAKHPVSLGIPSEYRLSKESLEDVVLEREWVGLTDYEVDQIEIAASSKSSAIYLAEAKLKDKNNAN